MRLPCEARPGPTFSQIIRLSTASSQVLMEARAYIGGSMATQASLWLGKPG